MIFEGLISVIGGGLLRLLPTIFDFFRARKEMDHELAMRKVEIQFEMAKLDKQMQIVDHQIAADQYMAGIEALVAANKAQAAQPSPTGNKWLDMASSVVYVLSQSVRPVITYWWVIVLYTGYKVALYATYIDNNVLWHQAIVQLWTLEDMGVLGSIIGFWFLDRVLPKK